MGTTEQLTGIIPTVVAGGIAIKFTDTILNKKRSLSSKRKSKSKRKNSRNSPY